MKKHILAVSALALAFAFNGNAAQAQEVSGLYFTPKILYSYSQGDMDNGDWNSGGWQRSAGLGKEDTDHNLGLGLSAGYNLGYLNDFPIRVEAEYIYRGEAEFGAGPVTVAGRTAGQNFKVTAHSLLGNIFLDIPTSTALTPYVGGGLGLAYLDTDYSGSANGASISASNSDFNFAWNLGGGVAWSLTDSVALDMGYRYVDLGTADSGDIKMNTYSGSSSVDYTAHELSVGLRISAF